MTKKIVPTKTKRTKRTPKSAEKPLSATRLAADGKRYPVDPANPLRFKEQPVDNEIRRAAERIGYTPTEPATPAPGLTPEDEAALAALRSVSGRVSPLAVAFLRACREGNIPNDELRQGLRGEAHDFNYLSERLSPEPETREDMLRDALEVLSAVQDIFYVDGELDTSADALMREALRSAEQELDLFSAIKESRGSDLHWQELWRASYRAKLARKLAEFKTKHPEWKPVKVADAGDETEGTAPAQAVAS